MNDLVEKAKQLAETHGNKRPKVINEVVAQAEEAFGKVTVTMKNKRCPACGRTEVRSSEANRRYWALLHEIAEKAKPKGLQYSAETWHLYFRQRLLGSEDMTLPNGKIVTQPNSTANLDVSDFSDYLDKVQAWAAHHEIYLED